LFSQVFGTYSRAYVEDVVAVLDKERVTHVVAFYGTGPIADIVAIKKARPKIKVVLNMLCHPQALSPAAIAWENWIVGRGVRYCDGLIYPSHSMETYCQRYILGKGGVPGLVWPPRLVRRFHAQNRLPACDNVPNLLFMGRVDWNSRGALESDNVGEFLKEMLARGVHVYHAYTPESDFRRQFPQHQHTFDYLPLERVTEYATQFDASLVMNNLGPRRRSDRFENTVPDRLVATVSAGVPVAIPSDGYIACKEYLKDYPAVLTFQSAGDLADQLRDRRRVGALREVAAVGGCQYEGERHVGRLLEFLQHVKR
jgi:hypothetical protein